MWIWSQNLSTLKCIQDQLSSHSSTATTFTTEACQETFKIQSGPLTCDSEKVLYLLKCKVCGEVPYVGKAKTKFRYRFNNYKSKHRAFRKGNRKVPQKLFHTHYCLDGHSGIEDWDFVIFEQCETHAQLKERETFWQHRLKTFYPIGLNEKEEYLYWQIFFLRGGKISA